MDKDLIETRLPLFFLGVTLIRVSNSSQRICIVASQKDTSVQNALQMLSLQKPLVQSDVLPITWAHYVPWWNWHTKFHLWMHFQSSNFCTRRSSGHYRHSAFLETPTKINRSSKVPWNEPQATIIIKTKTQFMTSFSLPGRGMGQTR